MRQKPLHLHFTSSRLYGGVVTSSDNARLTFSFLLFAILFSACTKKVMVFYPVTFQSRYFYEIDLNAIKEDRVAVKLAVHDFQGGEAVFNFPRIVPGIYGAMDFGRNIVQFKALANNDTLPVERLTVNSWKIRDAHRLTEIRYEVNDGWEEFGSGTTQGFYKSAESSFTEGKVFVINNNCLFGYFSGGEKWPVHIAVEKPAGLYAATSLRSQSKRPDKDDFYADNYRELVDNPVLYARPDTAKLQIGNTAVLVACYANSGQRIAPGIARNIRPLLENQRQYLGGALPVDHYTFLFYHTAHDRPNDYTGDGLEHSTSTLCLLNSQLDSAMLNNFVYGIASHEFFHILTPLNIHSEEIQNYDFLAPKMSRHIWLYEGLTEYATIHMPIKQELQSLEEFLSVLRQKAVQMNRFDNKIPLTELSQKAMERQEQYYNFYLKGALVSMCLDIRLRELSAGKYGTQEMMRDLAKRYGKDKPFRDDELFDVITTMTFPEMRAFFSDYIEGAVPLPLESYLAKAGIEFDEKRLRIQPMPHPTPEQLQLRKWWINQ